MVLHKAANTITPVCAATVLGEVRLVHRRRWTGSCQGEYNPPCGFAVRLHEAARQHGNLLGFVCLLQKRRFQVESDQTVREVLLLLKEYFSPSI